MKLKSLIIGLLIVLIAGIFAFTMRFILGGPEDDWVCANGQWEKHGNPNAPIPSASECR